MAQTFAITVFIIYAVLLLVLYFQVIQNSQNDIIYGIYKEGG